MHRLLRWQLLFLAWALRSSARLVEIPSEGCERGVAHMMFDALRIGVRRLRLDADRYEKLTYDPMALA
jgi:hypothetical protein